METVGACEAKTHLSKLIERVMKGERITITKHGIPVAVLQPPDKTIPTDVKGVIAQLRRFRENQSLGGLTLREMIEEAKFGGHHTEFSRRRLFGFHDFGSNSVWCPPNSLEFSMVSPELELRINSDPLLELRAEQALGPHQQDQDDDKKGQGILEGH